MIAISFTINLFFLNALSLTRVFEFTIHGLLFIPLRFRVADREMLMDEGSSFRPRDSTDRTTSERRWRLAGHEDGPQPSLSREGFRGDLRAANTSGKGPGREH
jgi:hypothetical protein